MIKQAVRQIDDKVALLKNLNGQLKLLPDQASSQDNHGDDKFSIGSNQQLPNKIAITTEAIPTASRWPVPQALPVLPKPPEQLYTSSSSRDCCWSPNMCIISIFGTTEVGPKKAW
jgi:hypothetical protein